MTAFINEFHYDNDGSDFGEFVEIAGPAGLDLTGWTLVLYNGSNSNLYNTIPLSGVLANQGDGFGFVDVETSGLQNGSPDGIALVDAGGNVVEFLSYEGSFTANDGPASGMTSTDIGVSEPGNTPIGFSLQRQGTGTTASDFTFAEAQAETPGAVNTGQSFATGAAALVITEIMYDPAVVADDQGEWIELYNAGTASVDLDGYTVGDAVGFSVTLNAVDLAPGEFYMLAKTVDAGIGLNADQTFEFALNNSGGDTVTLRDPSGNVIDSVAYTDIAPAGTSIRRIDPFAADSTFENNWEVGAVGGTPRSLGSTITSSVAIAATDADQAEGDTGTTDFTFTVTRTGITAGAADVDFAVTGDADADDFGGTLPSGTISFAAGETEQTLTVAVSGDTDVEADESFTVTLSNPTGGATLTTDTATGTIINDDSADPAPVGSVFINEFHYDNDGGDVGEFVEIAGPAGTDLSGYSLVLYNGNGGANYDTINLTGVIDDEGQGFGAVAFFRAGIQNGSPDGIALVDADGNVVEFLSYEGSFTAVGGPADGLTSTDIGVSESGNTPIGFSLQRQGTGTTASDFTFAEAQAETPGTLNTGQTIIAPGPVFTINEVDADQTRTDTAEFIEIYDGGVGNSALDGLVVVLFNGNGDVAYEAIDLDGQSTDADGFFVIGSGNVANVELVEFTSNDLQNGADAVALYEADATDFPRGTAATTTNLLDAVVYDTDDADDTDLLSALGQTVQFNESENGNPTGESLSRVPDGSGDFVAQAPTPGAANAPDTGGTGTQTITLISEVQGASDFSAIAAPQVGVNDISPLLGQIVTIEAIVTGDFQDGDVTATGIDQADLNGFYVQEEDADADGDALTSEGIFVFDVNATLGSDVNVGDLVRVTGTVAEFFGETQISATTVEVVSTGNTAPTATVVDLGSTGAILDDDGEWVVNLGGGRGDAHHNPRGPDRDRDVQSGPVRRIPGVRGWAPGTVHPEQCPRCGGLCRASGGHRVPHAGAG